MQTKAASKIKEGFVDALKKQSQYIDRKVSVIHQDKFKLGFKSIFAVKLREFEVVERELNSIRALTLDEHGFNVHTEDEEELSPVTREIVQQACGKALRWCLD